MRNFCAVREVFWGSLVLFEKWRGTLRAKTCTAATFLAVLHVCGSEEFACERLKEGLSSKSV